MAFCRGVVIKSFDFKVELTSLENEKSPPKLGGLLAYKNQLQVWFKQT
jgi:hypothetical protein